MTREGREEAEGGGGRRGREGVGGGGERERLGTEGGGGWSAWHESAVGPREWPLNSP
jgi:hypothetical protein